MNILYRNPYNHITGLLIQETLILKSVNTFCTSHHEVIKI